MAFEPFSADMNIISKISTNPSGEGMTPEELKAAFDRAGVLLKDYINSVLYPEIGKSVDVDAAITAYLDNSLTSADHPAGAKATGDAIRGLFTSAVHGGDYVVKSGSNFSYEMVGVRTINIGAGKAVMLGNIVSGSPASVELDAGEVGLNRNDLIVLRFSRTKDGVTTVSIVGVKGTETSGPPSDPTVSGDDINAAGAVTRDLPLYRVTFSGTSMEGVTALFAPEAPVSVFLFLDITVPASAWAASSDQSSAQYGYRASVPLTGVTSDMLPEVFLSVNDVIGANFSPVVSSYDGGVYIYAEQKPTATLTIPTIRLTRSGL